MTGDPLNKPRDSAQELGERIATEIGATIAHVQCGALTLGIPSLCVLGLIAVLVLVGVSPRTIEKGMVWLSVPWFAFCYALCKVAHETEVKIVGGDEE